MTVYTLSWTTSLQKTFKQASDPKEHFNLGRVGVKYSTCT